jgi:hypothetical protein
VSRPVVTLADLPATRRGVLQGLISGASPDDLAWALDWTPERVLETAQETLSRLGPDVGDELGARDRISVGNYLLCRQSPGQAAGTRELLERSPAARRWALGVREALGPLYPGERPGVPRVDADAGPREHARRDAGEAGDLERLRNARKREREELQERQARLVDEGPYLEEAIDEKRKGEDRIRLPHYASRPTRVALWILLGILAAGFVFCAVIRVPTHESGTVLVVSLPEGASGSLRGLSIVALFPSDTRRHLHVGQRLRVQLPDTSERVTTRISSVEDHVLSPRQIATRFGLDDVQAKRVRRPAAVALAELRVAPGSPRRRTFDGAVTNRADVRVGSRTIISLLS